MTKKISIKSITRIEEELRLLIGAQELEKVRKCI